MAEFNYAKGRIIESIQFISEEIREFEPSAHNGMFEFPRLPRELSQLLGCNVDLATPDALHKEMKEDILREAIRAALL